MTTDAEYREIREARMRKHLARSRWKGIMARCYDKANMVYDYYGGRGIEVDKSWHSFETFYADVGDPPDQYHTIDRIETKGNYAPGNWRWATKSEQLANRGSTEERYVNALSVILDDEGNQVTVRKAAEVIGCKPGTLRKRLKDLRDRHGIVASSLSDLKKRSEEYRV